MPAPRRFKLKQPRKRERRPIPHGIDGDLGAYFGDSALESDVVPPSSGEDSMVGRQSKLDFSQTPSAITGHNSAQSSQVSMSSQTVQSVEDVAFSPSVGGDSDASELGRSQLRSASRRTIASIPEEIPSDATPLAATAADRSQYSYQSSPEPATVASDDQDVPRRRLSFNTLSVPSSHKQTRDTARTLGSASTADTDSDDWFRLSKRRSPGESRQSNSAASSPVRDATGTLLDVTHVESRHSSPNVGHTLDSVTRTPLSRKRRVTSSPDDGHAGDHTVTEHSPLSRQQHIASPPGSSTSGDGASEVNTATPSPHKRRVSLASDSSSDIDVGDYRDNDHQPPPSSHKSPSASRSRSSPHKIRSGSRSQSSPHKIHSASRSQSSPHKIHSASYSQSSPHKIHSASHSQSSPHKIHSASHSQSSPLKIHSASRSSPYRIRSAQNPAPLRSKINISPRKPTASPLSIRHTRRSGQVQRGRSSHRASPSDDFLPDGPATHSPRVSINDSSSDHDAGDYGDDFADSPPPPASFSKSATKQKVSEQYSANALRPSKKAKKDRLNSSRVSFAASDDEPASPDDFADSPPPSASFSKSATKRKVSEQYSADALRPSKKAKKDRLNSSRVSFAASDDEPASPDRTPPRSSKAKKTKVLSHRKPDRQRRLSMFDPEASSTMVVDPESFFHGRDTPSSKKRAKLAKQGLSVSDPEMSVVEPRSRGRTPKKRMPAVDDKSERRLPADLRKKKETREKSKKSKKSKKSSDDSDGPVPERYTKITLPIDPDIDRYQNHFSHNTEPAGVRRSKRTRVRRLAYWANETLAYRPNKSGIGCTIVGVTQPDVPVAENVVTPVAIKVMQKTKKTKKPVHRGASDFDFKVEEIEDPGEERRVAVRLNQLGDMGEMDVFASAEGTARALYDSHMDNGVQFCKVAAAGNMEFGMLRVEPGSEKRVGNVQSKTIVFNIFSGSVTFNVAGTEQHLSRGACAIVPPYNSYSFINDSEWPATLTFSISHRHSMIL